MAAPSFARPPKVDEHLLIKSCALSLWLQIKQTQPSAKGVVNMSLGGAKGEYWDDWIKMLTDVGLATVVAAGNEDEDACTKSPAHVDEALTVGATTVMDTKTMFSNWGSCVQVSRAIGRP